MPETEYEPKQLDRHREARPISRRVFLKEVSLISLTAIAGSSFLQACDSKPPAMPPVVPVVPSSPPQAPVTKMNIMDALKSRKSTNAFQTQSLPKETLLELLWAAWGINRPDSGKRTAPSAVNAQEIDIYVLTAEGAFIYDAKGNQLTPVNSQDLRPRSATQGFMKDAPVHLIFVADYAKYRNIPQSQKELYSSCHTGFIGQNVYLYCAVQGLGAHFYASVDRAGLKNSLKLRDDQIVIFGQAVGYPKEQ
jgi:nitroreductase